MELKRSAQALIKYNRSNSMHGKIYQLSHVHMVNYLQLKPTEKQHGFSLEFSNSDTLVFYCASGKYNSKYSYNNSRKLNLSCDNVATMIRYNRLTLTCYGKKTLIYSIWTYAQSLQEAQLMQNMKAQLTQGLRATAVRV